MDGQSDQATCGGTSGNARSVRKCFVHEITVQIQARFANMILTCLQPPRGEAARILYGGFEGDDEDDDDGD
eukprot:2007228-Lingulodinium_polyedra.AAC.1